MQANINNSNPLEKSFMAFSFKSISQRKQDCCCCPSWYNKFMFAAHTSREWKTWVVGLPQPVRVHIYLPSLKKEPGPRRALENLPSYTAYDRKEQQTHGGSRECSFADWWCILWEKSFGIWSYAKKFLCTLHLTNWTKHKAILGAASTAQSLNFRGQSDCAVLQQAPAYLENYK